VKSAHICITFVFDYILWSYQTLFLLHRFYEARYSPVLLSIGSTMDIRDSIGLKEEDADVCILDEPEHLTTTMIYNEKPWTKSFKHVVGIMHTNYVAYMKANLPTLVIAPFVEKKVRLLTQVHCHKIIKLSDTLQTYAVLKECVNNVHGIRKDFLDEGIRRASLTAAPLSGIYFVGKLLWAKGLNRMIELENVFRRTTGEYFKIDIIGSGIEADEIKRAFHGRTKKSSSRGSLSELMNKMPKSRYEFRKEAIPASFPGRMDHALLTSYKIFINPSVTEVLCTTTAEVSICQSMKMLLSLK
jgi:digalactosyldiacylglycerol synthase